MKKIILLSCISLIPFTSKGFAMEKENPSESGTGHIGKRESFMSRSDSRDWNRYVFNKYEPNTSKQILSFEKIGTILQNTENNLNSEKFEHGIMLEKMNILSEKAQAERKLRREASTLDEYVVESNRRKPDISAMPEEAVQDEKSISSVVATKGGSLNNSTENLSNSTQVAKRNSLNTEQTKTRSRRLSLSLGSKKQDVKEEKSMSSVAATKGGSLKISSSLNEIKTKDGSLKTSSSLNEITSHKEKKKFEKRNSLNKEQTKEKTRTRRLSLSLGLSKEHIKEEKSISTIVETKGGFLKASSSLNEIPHKNEKKKMKKRLSLNAEKAKEKTETNSKRLSLSVDFKKTPVLEEKANSSEEKK